MRHVYVVIRCDHPKCAHSVTAPTQREAIQLAQRTGWAIRPDRLDDPAPHELCPEHWAKPATKETDHDHRP